MQCCQGIAKAKVVCNISMKGWEKPYQKRNQETSGKK